MNDRPTPETDASRGYALNSNHGRGEGSYLQMDRSGPFVHAEVARKLERERDEAWEKYSTEATEYMLSVNKLCGERDDARNKLADALQEIDLRTLDFERIKQERDEVIRQRDETNESSVFTCNFYYAEKLKAERERDEAREALEFRRGLYKLQEERLEKAERERDEARELVKAYKDYAHFPHWFKEKGKK